MSRFPVISNLCLSKRAGVRNPLVVKECTLLLAVPISKGIPHRLVCWRYRNDSYAKGQLLLPFSNQYLNNVVPPGIFCHRKYYSNCISDLA